MNLRAIVRALRPPSDSCAGCRHLQNDAAQVETLLAGVTPLSSAYASVRGTDGICLLHERLTNGRAACPDFTGSHAQKPFCRS